MNTSFLYHALGLKNLEYKGFNYENKSIVIQVQTSPCKLRCSRYTGCHVIRSGFNYRLFRCVPVGSRQLFIKMKVQRLYCKDCDAHLQEYLHFVKGKRSYTNRFQRFVVELSRIGTIKDVANFLHVSWDTVKDIQKRYLKEHFSNPSFLKVKRIGIDEFAISKGHVYKTIVVDLDTSRVIYMGDGKSAASLDKFWHKVRKKKVKIEAVATDLSAAYISSVMTNAPDAILVFDHFHIVKLMNDTIDNIRRDIYREETDLNKRKVIKGTRWLLLCNGKDIFDDKFKSRLDNALKLNKSLAQAYYLKESLKEIWTQETKQKAEDVLYNWVDQARESKTPRLLRFARTLLAHRFGVLAWYDCRISTGKVEGINNKIKTMKRKAYGYRDQEFFKLKIYAMHKNKYAFAG